MIRLTLLCLALLAANPGIAQSNIVIANGNKIEFSKEQRSFTFYLTDDRIPEEEKVKKEIWVEMLLPVKLNDKDVVCDDKAAPMTKGGKRVSEVIFTGLENDLAQLGNGNYHLGLAYILVDERGKIVDYDTVYNCRVERRSGEPVSGQAAAKLKEHFIALLNTLDLQPAPRHGKKRPVVYPQPLISTTIEVVDGKVRLH